MLEEEEEDVAEDKEDEGIVIAAGSAGILSLFVNCWGAVSWGEE